MITKEEVLDALRTVQEPELGEDLVSLDMIRDVRIDGDTGLLHRGPHDSGLPAGDGDSRNGARKRSGGCPAFGTWESR